MDVQTARLEPRVPSSLVIRRRCILRWDSPAITKQVGAVSGSVPRRRRNAGSGVFFSRSIIQGVSELWAKSLSGFPASVCLNADLRYSADLLLQAVKKADTESHTALGCSIQVMSFQLYVVSAQMQRNPTRFPLVKVTTRLLLQSRSVRVAIGACERLRGDICLYLRQNLYSPGCHRTDIAVHPFV